MEGLLALAVGTPGIAAGTTAVTGPALGSLAASGAIATAPTLAASAATTGLFGAAGAFTPLGIISGGLSVLSAGSSIMGGIAGAQGMQYQAKMQEIQARQELIKGLQQSNEIRNAELDALAWNNARFGAANISLRGGTPETLRGRIMEQANRQASVSRLNARAGYATRRAAAQQSRAGATGALLGGVAEATGPLISIAQRLA